MQRLEVSWAVLYIYIHTHTHTHTSLGAKGLGLILILFSHICATFLALFNLGLITQMGLIFGDEHKLWSFSIFNLLVLLRPKQDGGRYKVFVVLWTTSLKTRYSRRGPIPRTSNHVSSTNITITVMRKLYFTDRGDICWVRSSKTLRHEQVTSRVGLKYQRIMAFLHDMTRKKKKKTTMTRGEQLSDSRGKETTCNVYRRSYQGTRSEAEEVSKEISRRLATAGYTREQTSVEGTFGHPHSEQNFVNACVPAVIRKGQA